MKTMGEPWQREDCPDGVKSCHGHYTTPGAKVYDIGHTDSRNFHYVNEVENLARDKRFTDAELAAEYWRASANPRIRAYQRDEAGNVAGIPGTGWEYEHQIMRRLATRPNYDEDTRP